MSGADGILEDMSARMRCPVLVGRAEHLGTLEAALGRARAGGPSTLLIGGEAGIGKSRLVSEFATRASDQGARWSLIYGGTEEEEGAVTVRDMTTGEQSMVPVGELADHLARLAHQTAP